MRLRITTTCILITASLSAYSGQICDFENIERVKFSKVENLDSETSRDYSNDILVATFDINNDGVTETVFSTKLMVGGIKCWGDLLAFSENNSLLGQSEINIRDLYRKADINLREVGNTQWQSSPDSYPHANIYRSCVAFQPFKSNNKLYIKAEGMVVEMKGGNIHDVCKYR